MEKPGARFGRIYPLERVWRERYAAHQGGKPLVMPRADILTADEFAFHLRLDILCRGSRRSGMKALQRLIERRLIEGVCYAGVGGGERCFSAAEVGRMLERLG